MRAEISFPEELVKEIVDKIADRLKSLIATSDKQADEDVLMNIHEAAAFLNTSKDQVYQWVNNAQHGLGQFPYFKAGRLLRFSKIAILKWLESDGKKIQ